MRGLAARLRVMEVSVDDLLSTVSEVAETLGSCFGPLPREKLLVSSTRRVWITSSRRRRSRR